jgi:hypothetical protein
MLDKYEGPGTVILGNDIQMEATTVRYSYNANARPVVTMRKGLAGRSLGPGQSSFSVTSAIPRAGMESDVLAKCVADADVTVTFVLAGKRYQIEGWIDTVNVEQSEANSASVSFDGTGIKPTILPA